MLLFLLSTALILTTLQCLFCLPGAFGSRLPGRHPVVRLRLRQAAAGAPASSAEPAGAVSGCRYGPMRENPACSDRSGRAPCRAVAWPRHPAKGRRDVATPFRARALRAAAGPCSLPAGDTPA